MKIHPVILSGGAGSRLWPRSRENFPKPLLPLVSDSTLLQETVTRLHGQPHIAWPIFVCNEEHRFLLAEQVRSTGLEIGKIILEPKGRNTAPALTLAALALVDAGDAEDVMVVMPADHVIQDSEAFNTAVQHAAELASQGCLVTFGIEPTSPETGYGYIRRGQRKTGDESAAGMAYDVAAFVEKPDAETAQAYLSEGGYYWNSGIFVIQAKVWLQELTNHRADIYAACQKAMQARKEDLDFTRVDEQAFLDCPSDSIDYAVMEKTSKAVVLPMISPWSDVGTWSSIWEVSDQDGMGNVVQGDVLHHDVENSLLFAEHRMIGAVGLRDIMVVETADAILVVPKDRTQDVKEIVTQLKQHAREEYKFHRRVYRPWGSYEGIDAGPRFQVKRLSVKPGASLSLQLHHHRAEHWIVVKGTAEVTRGDDVFTLSENQSTYIPLGVKHRLSNPGKLELEMIEVQSGSYLGEDDIVRFDDIYDRC